MQGTVATFDATSRTGDLLTDDGRRLDYAAEALADHIRLLRVGQRVFVDTDAATQAVTRVAIWR
jgi:2-phospho-L-lactate guanylyltransferase